MIPDKIGAMFPFSEELVRAATKPSLITALFMDDIDHYQRVLTDPLYRRHGPPETPEHMCQRWGHDWDDEAYDGYAGEDDVLTFRCLRCNAPVAYTRVLT